MRNNLLMAFLKILNVKYTDSYSREYFEEHPYKDSLYGLSEMLTHYNVKNKGIRIKDASIRNLPKTPFVTNIGKSFLIVTDITDTKIRCLWNNKKTDFQIDSFFKEWQGTALVAQVDSTSIEPDYKRNKRLDMFMKLSKLALVLFPVLLFLFFYVSNSMYLNLEINIFFAINLCGIYINSVLLLKEINGYNQSVDYICSLLKNGNCNNILTSEYSHFLGLISWSEIGLGYFISNLLLILLIPNWLSYLYLINYFTLPYTLWSVWCQKYRIKAWCILCLSIQCLLWGIFLTGIFLNHFSIRNIDVLYFFIVAGLFLFCIFTINRLLILHQQSKQKRVLAYKLNTLKMKENIFLTLLRQQPYYPVSIDDSQIIFGNPDEKFKITILSNPHCLPCRKMHSRIQRLLDLGKNISVQYIFSSFNESLDISNKFLCSAYINNSLEKACLIYDEWFNNVSQTNQQIFEKYQLDLTSISVQNEFYKHNRWRKEVGISETPTILVNGYKLPSDYTVEDLIYLTNIDI